MYAGTSFTYMASYWNDQLKNLDPGGAKWIRKTEATFHSAYSKDKNVHISSCNGIKENKHQEASIT